MKFNFISITFYYIAVSSICNIFVCSTSNTVIYLIYNSKSDWCEHQCIQSQIAFYIFHWCNYIYSAYRVCSWITNYIFQSRRGDHTPEWTFYCSMRPADGGIQVTLIVNLNSWCTNAHNIRTVKCINMYFHRAVYCKH